MNWKEAFGQSCLIVGGMGTVLVIGIGIIKIIELGIDRLFVMVTLLAFTIPITLIGYWLLRPYIHKKLLTNKNGE